MDILFMGNYTQDLIAKEFEKKCASAGFDADIHVTGFDQYRFEIINSEAETYKIKPDVIYLSIDLHTLIEDISFSVDKTKDKQEIITGRINDTISLVRLLAEKLPSTQIFIDNFFYFRPSIMATLEYNSPVGFIHTAEIANSILFDNIREVSNVNIIDVKSMVMQYGSINLFDERMHYVAKNHWSFSGIQKLAGLYIRYLKAFKGKRKKCLVLDLDNTLWGGIIGDDGMENLQLSNDGPGKAFYDFQREILKLYHRGILLAINSKNTEEVALEAIEKHPYMVLKKEHFISMKINWQNKAQNIKAIAEEINIGMDSLVFLDDSGFEREVISSQFPEVLVPELPQEPSEYAQFLRKLDVFDFLSVTKDDFRRNEMYKANIKRDKLKDTVVDIEDFYYSLKMIATINTISSFHVPRIAQMTQKTNQFNLTTIRYTEAEIKQFMQSEKEDVYYLNLADKFGDNGIVGTAIIEKDDSKADINSFIFSCRVLGRTAETAFLKYILNDLKKQGMKEVIGKYIPTKKNMPCKDFYKNHQFKLKSDNTWVADLQVLELKDLPWIKIESE